MYWRGGKSILVGEGRHWFSVAAGAVKKVEMTGDALRVPVSGIAQTVVRDENWAYACCFFFHEGASFCW